MRPLDSPQRGEPLDRGRGRVAGEHRAVDRADAGADDEVGGDAGGQQRLEHADLVRAEDTAAAEHERGRPRHAGRHATPSSGLIRADRNAWNG